MKQEDTFAPQVDGVPRTGPAGPRVLCRISGSSLVRVHAVLQGIGRPWLVWGVVTGTPGTV